MTVLLSIFWCVMALITPLNLQTFQKMIVIAPVANLRKIPQAHDPSVTLPTSDLTNPLQITQLLFGDQVIAHEMFIDEKNKTWWYINTPQQQYFYEPIGWHGYPGWILDEDLIEVEDFMPDNLVICSKLTMMFYRNDERIESLSIGTRLFGVQKMHNFYHIVTPNREIAYIHADDIYPLTEIVEESAREVSEGEND